MALIKCPECGHEVSDTAVTCPNCGYCLKKKDSVDVSKCFLRGPAEASNIVLIVVGIIVVLVSCCLCGRYIVSDSKVVMSLGIVMVLLSLCLIITISIMASRIDKNKKSHKYIAEFISESNSLKCCTLKNTVEIIPIKSIVDIKYGFSTDYLVKVIYLDQNNARKKALLGFSKVAGELICFVNEKKEITK